MSIERIGSGWGCRQEVIIPERHIMQLKGEAAPADMAFVAARSNVQKSSLSSSEHQSEQNLIRQ